MPWDARFFDRSTMFEPYACCAERLSESAGWPDREALDALLRERGVRNARGLPLHAVAAEADGAAAYERRVYESGGLAVRAGEWHDLMNVLVWCAFPATKAALNARHVAAAQDEAGGNRGRTRDALTLFDESGAIVGSSAPDLIDDLRAFRWKALFVTKRERVRSCLRVFLFGHGLLEKGLAPYVGMTAQAITLTVDREVMEDVVRVDEAAAKYVAETLATPRDLAPLPVLGIPGWWENEDAAFYDNTRYFRPGRRNTA